MYAKQTSYWHTDTKVKSHKIKGPSLWLLNYKLRERSCPVLPVTAASISNNTHLSWTLAETESATPFIRTMGWPLLHISNVTHKWHLHWFLHWPGTTHIHNADVSSYPVHLCPELTIVVSFTILPLCNVSSWFFEKWNHVTNNLEYLHSIEITFVLMACSQEQTVYHVDNRYGYLRLGCPR